MMKVSPTGAISRLGIRLRERRNRSAAGDRPALTETDDANIAQFERLIRDAVMLLDKENVALEEGDVGLVAEFFDAKSELLKSLELRQPVIEPFLREDIPEIATLRSLIRELSDQLQRNGQLLKGMAEASRSIISEVERVRKRQGLSGLYDKSGQLRPDVGNFEKKFEKNL